MICVISSVTMALRIPHPRVYAAALSLGFQPWKNGLRISEVLDALGYRYKTSFSKSLARKAYLSLKGPCIAIVPSRMIRQYHAVVWYKGKVHDPLRNKNEQYQTEEFLRYRIQTFYEFQKNQ